MRKNEMTLKRLNLDSLKRQARAAQKGEKFQPGCTGKKRYESGAEATDAANYYRDHNKAKQSTYRCRHCGGWHVTKHGK